MTSTNTSDNTRKAPSQLSSQRKRTRMPRGTTTFGQVLDELRARYVFHNRDLVGNGNLLTLSDIEQISRMSTRLDAIVAMSTERRYRLVSAVAEALIEHLTERGRWPNLLLGLRQRVEEQLLSAIENDLVTFEQNRLSIDVVNRLVEWTNRPLEQLAADIYEPGATLKKVCRKWCEGETEEGSNEYVFAPGESDRGRHAP